MPLLRLSHWPLLLNRGGGVCIHAERLLAKAGGSNCKERGISHPCNGAQREWKGRSKAEGCTSEARKPGETPCGREGAELPLGGFVLGPLSVRQGPQSDRLAYRGYHGYPR